MSEQDWAKADGPDAEASSLIAVGDAEIRAIIVLCSIS